MKSYANIFAPATGFTADPDPVADPELVPPEALFKLPDSLPGDGVANVLQLWLEQPGAADTETFSFDLWAIDDDSITYGPGMGLNEVFKPSADNRWTKLNPAPIVVTAPLAFQLVNGRPFAGILYARRISSTLTLPSRLKIGAGHI